MENMKTTRKGFLATLISSILAPIGLGKSDTPQSEPISVKAVMVPDLTVLHNHTKRIVVVQDFGTTIVNSYPLMPGESKIFLNLWGFFIRSTEKLVKRPGEILLQSKNTTELWGGWGKIQQEAAKAPELPDGNYAFTKKYSELMRGKSSPSSTAD